MDSLSKYIETGAEISPCENYRYALWRIWSRQKPAVLWIMHNPSTADAFADDPTIRRIVQFSKDWGYGGIYVGNISAYRATDPAQMAGLHIMDVVKQRNFEAIGEMIKLCDLHVLAHGIPVKKIRSVNIENFFNQVTWRALRLSKEGYPCHPLYLPKHLVARRIDLLRNEKS